MKQTKFLNFQDGKENNWILDSMVKLVFNPEHSSRVIYWKDS